MNNELGTNGQMNNTLLVRFKIRDNLRFLSHHETMVMFQRAFARARIELCYSAGFNPRPRLSLPLPRSVGIESDAELACALVAREPCLDPEQVKEQICRQMPQGCEITSVDLLPGKVSYRPVSAVYVFSLACSNGDERIRTAVEDLRRTLAAGDKLVVQRRSHPAKPARSTDISAYIDSIETEPTGLAVKCNITGAGTVRPDEILQLLQIDSSQLSGPVKRKSVQWRSN
jgi:radical SAM-linked protein